MTSLRPPAYAMGLAAYIVVLGVAVAGVPFQSDDYAHLAAAAQWSGPGAVFDPALVPLRPLQHLWFYLVERLAPDSPALARAPILALHLCAVLLTVRLARQLGLPRASAWLVASLVAAFPNVTNVTWVAAIGWPLRQVFVLLAITSFVGWWRGRRARDAALVFVGLLGGLGSHQSAFLVPAYCCAWLVFVESRGATIAWRRMATDPVLLGMLLLVACYVVYVGMLRPERHHGVQSSGVILANAARALWGVVPGFLRWPVLEWLRTGGAWTWLGMSASLLWVALLALVCARSGIGRFVVACVALDLAVTAVSVPGFEHRYTYLSSALAAGGLAVWAARGGRPARAVVAAIAAGWFAETLSEVHDYRVAGAAMRGLRDDVVAADQERGPGGALVFVDIPAGLGRDQVVPVFRWGFPEALRVWGIDQPWTLWRTDPVRSTAQGEWVEPADLAARVAAAVDSADGGVVVLRFDRDTRRCERLGGDR